MAQAFAEAQSGSSGIHARRQRVSGHTNEPGSLLYVAQSWETLATMTSMIGKAGRAFQTPDESTPACWPTASQELLIEAGFGAEAQARTALDAWRGQTNSEALDPASQRFLPQLFDRWGEELRDDALRERAYLALVATWRRQQRHFLVALRVARDLEQEGVETIFLKGLALSLCHYRNPGLRAMEDVDLLVPPRHVETAVQTLQRTGWIPEEGASAQDILRQKRVRHAWQFNTGEIESCDLHWHPVVRCYSPVVAELFWKGAQDVQLLNRQVRVPCPTDLLFHVCAHGLQWSWTPQIRWIPDALTILQGPAEIDWERLFHLASEAEMNVRLQQALDYLRRRFAAAVPAGVLSRLAGAGGRREHREYTLLQKECPLGLVDRAMWHTTNFRRIRRFDSDWSKQPWGAAFADYLILFMNQPGLAGTTRALIKEIGTT